MEQKKTRFMFVDIMKTIGVLLVINSHFDSLYPLPVLATGGAIGNSLFFAASGFLLWPINPAGGGKNWILKKLLRLYIPTLLMTFISLLTVSRGLFNLSNAFFVFVWPTMFWFIGAMVLFYVLFYLLRGVKSKKQFAVFFAFLSCIYFAFYMRIDTTSWIVETTWRITDNGLEDIIYGCLKHTYCFAIFMAGKYFKENMDTLTRSPWWYLTCVAGSFVSLYAFKFLMVKYPALTRLQFLNQVSTVAFAVSVLLLGISLEKRGVFRGDGAICKCARWVSVRTLEIYVVQGVIISYAERLGFPINVICAVLFIFIGGTILHWVAERITKSMSRWSVKSSGKTI